MSFFHETHKERFILNFYVLGFELQYSTIMVWFWQKFKIKNMFH